MHYKRPSMRLFMRRNKIALDPRRPPLTVRLNGKEVNFRLNANEWSFEKTSFFLSPNRLLINQILLLDKPDTYTNGP